MTVRLTTLSENTATYGFLAEWGFSLLVEVDDLKVLLDTGLSFSAVHNAQLLGIDLSTVDVVVLSHGHADHTGGLRDMLRRRSREVEVIAHPDMWEPKYSRRQSQPERYVGIPFTREALENAGARFHLTREPVPLGSRVVTSGEIPMTTTFEQIESDLFVRQDRILIPDPLADDLALAVKTDKGLVVALGCAHRGLINTLRHFQKLTGDERVHTVVGGTHLLRASEKRIVDTVAALQEMGVQKLGVSHCTGFPAEAKLAAAFGDVFFLNNAGTRLTIA